AHTDAVGDGGHAEHLGLGAGRLERGHRAVHERLYARVAGIHGRVAVGDADDGLLEIAVAEAHGAEHRAVGGAGGAASDELAALVEGHGGTSVTTTYNLPVILAAIGNFAAAPPSKSSCSYIPTSI